jgi:hypothetical protein
MANIINPSELTPLTIHSFKLFAPAQANGQKTSAFLDTGAGHDNVSQKLAESLPRTGAVQATGAFEQRNFDTVGEVEIGFMGSTHTGSAYVDRVPADESLPFNADLSLGAPTIFAKPLLFDFRLLGIMTLQSSSREDWISLPAKYIETKDICIVQFTSQDGTIQALFDTGAGLSVVNSAHVEEIKLDLRLTYELGIYDAVGAKTNQQLAACSNLQIGDSVMPSFDCFFADLQAIEKGLGCRIDMVFGANAMLKSGFRWLFDRASEKAFVAL